MAKAKKLEGAPAPLVDDRSALEKAQTSHLSTFAPVEVEDDATPAPLPDVGDLKLPKDIKETLELLADTQNSRYESDPELTAPENHTAQVAFEAKREIVTDRIREHLFAIQQGPKTPVLTAAAHQNLSTHTSAHATEFKLIELARSHPEVRALLADRDDLLKQIETLTKKAA